MSETDIQAARHAAKKDLLAHEVKCEARYGELRTRIAKLDTALARNTALLKTVLGTQLALAAAVIAAALKSAGA